MSTTISTAPVVNLNALAGHAGLTYNVISNINLANDTTFQGDGTANFNFSGAINGNGNLAKSGTSTLILASANTCTGSTTIDAGTLRIGNGGTTGTLSGGAVTNNAALVFQRSNAYSVSNAISGTGSLTQSGTGTLLLAGANTYGGGTTVSAGTLQARTTETLPLYGVAGKVVVGSGGTLAVNTGGTGEWGPTDIDTLRANAIFNSGSTLGIDTANATDGFTYSNEISGNQGLTKLGANTLTLAAANNYSGNTMIRGGTLLLENANALQMSTLNYGGYGGTVRFGTLTNVIFGGLKGNQALSLVNDSSSALALTVGNNNQSTTYSGGLGGTGSLIKVGTNTLTLTGVNTYAGGTTINAGMVRTNNAAALSGYNTLGKVVVNNGGTLAINAGGSGEWTAVNVAALLSHATFSTGSALGIDTTNASGGYFAYGNVIGGSLGLIKLGTNTLTLSGANSYSGDTTINGGTLMLARNNALANSTLDYKWFKGGVLSFGTLTDATLGGLKGDLGLSLTNSNSVAVALTVGNNSQSTTYSGALSGAGR